MSKRKKRILLAVITIVIVSVIYSCSHITQVAAVTGKTTLPEEPNGTSTAEISTGSDDVTGQDEVRKGGTPEIAVDQDGNVPLATTGLGESKADTTESDNKHKTVLKWITIITSFAVSIVIMRLLFRRRGDDR